MTVAKRESVETTEDDSGVLRRRPVEKVIQLLTCMVDDEASSWGVREIARKLDWPPSTAHRVLSDLEDLGLVQLDHSGGKYSLGLEFFRLAWKGTASVPISSAAIPALQAMVEQLNETACLAVYDQTRERMMFASAVESTRDVRYVVVLNRWLPLTQGASGLAILSYLDEETRAKILGEKIAAAPNGEARDEISLQVARVRAKGYAVTWGERVPGAIGIASPVFDANDAVVGSVGLTIPGLRFSDTDERRFASAVTFAAMQITSNLGGSEGAYRPA